MLANDLPIEKLAWFAASSAIGSASAGCGYLSRSGERTPGAALVSCANGLIVGLFASLLASRYTECDPVWLILGAILLGWPSGLVGVVRTMMVAWNLRLQILSMVKAGNAGWQAMLNHMLQNATPPTPPSPPAKELDDGSSTRPP
jgi:hypothetical protein